jgi:hypothetical protein
MTDTLAPYHAFPRATSPLRRFVDSLRTAESAASGVTPFARAGLHTLRSAGTTAVLSAALGAVDGKWGLDYGKKKVPVDGVLALAGAAGSLFLARDPDGLGVEARSVMASAGSIFLYRKVKAWAELKSSPHYREHGGGSNDNAHDPVMAAAGSLDDVAAQ